MIEREILKAMSRVRQESTADTTNIIKEIRAALEATDEPCFLVIDEVQRVRTADPSRMLWIALSDSISKVLSRELAQDYASHYVKQAVATAGWRSGQLFVYSFMEAGQEWCCAVEKCSPGDDHYAQCVFGTMEEVRETYNDAGFELDLKSEHRR